MQQHSVNSRQQSRFPLKEMALSLFLLLLEPVQCLGQTFCTLSYAQSRKILSKFSKLSAILKHCNDDVSRVSVL